MQDLDNEFSHDLLVLDHQHGLARSARDLTRLVRRGWLDDVCDMTWEADADCGTASHLAFDEG